MHIISEVKDSSLIFTDDTKFDLHANPNYEFLQKVIPTLIRPSRERKKYFWIG